MNTYHIICEKYINSNTAEHGFGDYPEYRPYVAITVEAETIRKAYNKAKKIDSSLSFGGQFGNYAYIDAELPDFLRKTIKKD